MVAGGVESISLLQNDKLNLFRARNEWLMQHKPELYLSMIETADIVARRYGISREAQDEYALASQQRTAAAQEAGRFDDEIVPFAATMLVKDKQTGEVSEREITLERDECNRPNTTLEGLAGPEPVRGPDQFVTAGNASQLSDGASVCMVMDGTYAQRHNIEPMGIFRGFAVAGCEPDEMGIGPVYAIPRLLERNGLTLDDIDLWELNEAFGHVVIGWLWLRQAQCAVRGLTGGKDEGGPQPEAFYTGKRQACDYFCRYELPRAEALSRILQQADVTALEMQPDWF